jgi:phosphohistidine phosphatase SixA
MLLLILRHGQAHDRPPPAHANADGGSDHHRELTDLGRQQARFIGGLLAAHARARPARVLVSSATRARQTAEAVLHDAAAVKLTLEFCDELLVDRPPDLALELIERTLSEMAGSAAPREAQSLLVVGHNPQLTEVVFTLARAATGRVSSEPHHAGAARASMSDAAILPPPTRSLERFDGLRTGEMAVFNVEPPIDGSAMRCSAMGTYRLAEVG